MMKRPGRTLRWFLLTLALFVPASTASESVSVTTSVAPGACLTIDPLEAEQLQIAKGAAALFECRGIQNHTLYIADDGTRSWLVLKIKNELFSMEEEIVYQNSAGDFPNIGPSDEVQWLLTKDGTTVGLIFNVSYQTIDSETGRFKTITRYFAVSLRQTPPKVIGRTSDAIEAKGLLIEQ